MMHTRRSSSIRRSRINSKKIFILLVGIVIISIVGIIIFTGSLKDNILDVNAQTLEDKNSGQALEQSDESYGLDEQKEPESIALDNSGYLSLENDTNADDASVVLPETMHKWNFYREDGKKTVYLTFDDGPSIDVTTQILDILDANDVKATFFVLGSTIEANPNSSEILKRMAKNGHAIANHGYSHNYKILYPNGIIDVKAFMNDMDKNIQLLKSILGKDFDTRVIRMPGGYGTWYGVTPLNEALAAKGYYQTDWNSLNGDAEGKHKNPEQMLNKLKETMLDYDTLIVLMHDTNDKKNTVKYLQSAIDYLKLQGFEFRTLK